MDVSAGTCAGTCADTVSECYICYEGESEATPFVREEQCQCMRSNVIHNTCFKRLLEKGEEVCSICKIRWAFLPAICHFEYVRHGITYSVECMKDRKGRYYGSYKEWVVDASGNSSQLHLDTQYRNGVLDGWLIVYDKKGRMRRRVFYDKGVKNVSAIYYRHGVTLVFSSFMNGVRHGQSLFLKKDGSYHFVRDYYYGKVLNR